MGDLISRNAIIDILENEINAAKELECQCEEQYKNGFVLKQCIYSFVKECVEALPSINEIIDKIVNELTKRIERLQSLNSEDQTVDVAIKETQRIIEIIQSAI